MNQELVIVEKQDSIARVTLNRPEVLNALSAAMRRAIVDTFQELSRDAEVQVIILTGAGRAFCAGLDLKEMGGEVASIGGLTGKDFSGILAATPQPIICAVNGYAITGGFELALMCDLIIASDEAMFADTHARLGIVPGWGLSQKLPRMIGINRAKELSLTGNYLDAGTAYEWGLVNHVVRPEALLATCESMARDIATTEPGARATILEIMDAGWQTTLEEGFEIEQMSNKNRNGKEGSAEKIAARRAALQVRGREQARS